MANSIMNRLEAVFRNTFDDDSIELSSEVTADDIDGWDSLTHVKLIMAVEREFRISLAASEIAALKNVGDLVRRIEAKGVV